MDRARYDADRARYKADPEGYKADPEFSKQMPLFMDLDGSAGIPLGRPQTETINSQKTWTHTTPKKLETIGTEVGDRRTRYRV
jgi:hypothetical protein